MPTGLTLTTPGIDRRVSTWVFAMRTLMPFRALWNVVTICPPRASIDGLTAAWSALRWAMIASFSLRVSGRPAFFWTIATGSPARMTTTVVGAASSARGTKAVDTAMSIDWKDSSGVCAPTAPAPINAATAAKARMDLDCIDPPAGSKGMGTRMRLVSARAFEYSWNFRGGRTQCAARASWPCGRPPKIAKLRVVLKRRLLLMRPWNRVCPTLRYVATDSNCPADNTPRPTKSPLELPRHQHADRPRPLPERLGEELHERPLHDGLVVQQVLREEAHIPRLVGRADARIDRLVRGPRVIRVGGIEGSAARAPPAHRRPEVAANAGPGEEAILAVHRGVPFRNAQQLRSRAHVDRRHRLIEGRVRRAAEEPERQVGGHARARLDFHALARGLAEVALEVERAGELDVLLHVLPLHHAPRPVDHEP